MKSMWNHRNFKKWRAHLTKRESVCGWSEVLSIFYYVLQMQEETKALPFWFQFNLLCLLLNPPPSLSFNSVSPTFSTLFHLSISLMMQTKPWNQPTFHLSKNIIYAILWFIEYNIHFLGLLYLVLYQSLSCSGQSSCKNNSFFS